MRTLLSALWLLLATFSLSAQTWINYPSSEGRMNYTCELPSGKTIGTGYLANSINGFSQYRFLSFEPETGLIGINTAPDGIYTYGGQYTYTHDDEGYIYSVGGTGTGGRYFTKLDSTGSPLLHVLLDLEWHHISEPVHLKKLSNGDFLYISHYVNNSRVYRLDNQGNILWARHFEDYVFSKHAVHENEDNTLNFVTFNPDDGPWDLRVSLLSEDGLLIENFIETNVTGYTNVVFRPTEEGILIVANKDPIYNKVKFFKYNYQAEFQSSFFVPVPDLYIAKEVHKLGENRIAVMGQAYAYTPAPIFITILDSLGNVINHEEYTITEEIRFNSFQKTIDNGLLISGYSLQGSGAPDVPFLLKTDSLAEAAVSYIHGTLFQDDNDDCDFDTSDFPMANWLVGFIDTDTIYRATNSNGEYSFLVNSGTYELTALLYTPFFDFCDPPTFVTVPPGVDSVLANFATSPLLDCPYMAVDVTTPLLRRCYTNQYYVAYFNQGSDTAFNAYVEVQFDQYLDVQSANHPFTDIGDNTFEFDLGDLPPGANGGFTIDAWLNCDSTILGMAHCVTAHIYPDSLCSPPDPQWTEASLQLNGICDTDTDTVRFFVENVGQGPMGEYLEYIVIEDDIIMNAVNDTIQLNPGEQTEIALGSNGSTWRVNVDQVNFHPGLSSPTMAIEGCGTNQSGEFSIGYVTMFPEDEQDHFVAKDCRENVSSYDPNYKEAGFKGYRENHYIEANQPLEYTIHFQNIGTDTAFTVIIYDQLSPYLDHLSIQPSISSHDYFMEMQPGGLVKFTFPNILLPDSTTNEPASHGFVKFNIDQVPDNPVNTVIKNSAEIYFDFNAPIVTNTVFHTIGEDFIEIQKFTSVYEELEIELALYPNPWVQEATLILKGMDLPGAMLQVYTQDGRFAHQQEIQNNLTRIHRNALNPGLYYFRIVQGRRTIGTGQFIIAGE